MNNLTRHTLLILSSFLVSWGSLQAQNPWYDAARQALRKGTKALASGDTTAAQAAFQEARQTREGYAKAEYNAGYMQHAAGAFDSAQAAFGLSASLSPDSLFSSDAYYNQGNSLMAGQKFQESVEAYKNALRQNPGNADARYNLAYALQMLKAQQEQDKNEANKDKPDPPSEFAKKLKAQADALLIQRKYAAAQKLMEQGLQQDPTVENYQDYISRLGEITGINPKQE